MSKLWRLRKRDRGSIYGETAFAFPVILLVTLMMIQAGFLAWGANAANNAARHGARMASVVQTDPVSVAISEARAAAVQDFPLDASPVVQVLAPGGLPGSELTVRVQVRVPNVMGPASALFTGSVTRDFTVSGEATFRQEGW